MIQLSALLRLSRQLPFPYVEKEWQGSGKPEQECENPEPPNARDSDAPGFLRHPYEGDDLRSCEKRDVEAGGWTEVEDAELDS